MGVILTVEVSGKWLPEPPQKSLTVAAAHVRKRGGYCVMSGCQTAF